MLKIKDYGPVRCYKQARHAYGPCRYTIACYRVDGLMIDTGCAHLVKKMIAALEGEQITRIVNTHSHEDHVGANAAIASKYGLTPLTHFLELPGLITPKKEQALLLYQKILFGNYEPWPGRALGDTLETENYHFEVIHTHGHSSGHVSLFEPDQRWLFSGDAYIGGRDRSLRIGYDIHQIINGLETLAALNPKIMFCGSGSVKENATEAINKKLDYLKSTREKVQNLRKQGMSRKKIGKKLFGAHQPMAYVTQFTFSRDLLVNSCLDDGKDE